MHITSLALFLGLFSSSLAAPTSLPDLSNSTLDDHSLESRDVRGKRLRVLGLGDSITWGFSSSDGNGWRDEVLNGLKSAGADTFMVGTVRSGNMANGLSEGYPRHTIDQISARLTQTHTAFTGDFIPNVVLLHAGTNDCNIPVDPATANVRLGKLIDQVRGYWPQTAIIVAKVIASSTPQTQDNISILNQKIQADITARYNAGQHVGYVDMSNALSPNLYADKLHPNDAGYAVMANYWLDAIDFISNVGWI